MELSVEQAARLLFNYFVDSLAEQLVKAFDVTLREYPSALSDELRAIYEGLKSKLNERKQKPLFYEPNEVTPLVGNVATFSAFLKEVSPQWYREIYELAWRRAGALLAGNHLQPLTDEIEARAKEMLEVAGIPSSEPETITLRKIIARKLLRALKQKSL